MKILPTISSGIVLMHEDGTFEMAPFQVFRSSDSKTIIRIGNNTLWFNEDGTFSGSECRIPGGGLPIEEAATLQAAFEIQGSNKGRAPAEPYFEEETVGWKKELAGWPKTPVTH
jgi:hypothetical protein